MKKDLPNLEKRGSYNNIEINNGMMVYPVLSLKRCHGVSLARYFSVFLVGGIIDGFIYT